MSMKHKAHATSAAEPPSKKQAVQLGQGSSDFRLIEALRHGDYIQRDLGSGCQTYTLKDDSIDWLYQKTGQPLIVRLSTREIYEKIKKMKESRNDVLITGNPGIGKTWFHNYFLLRWIPEMKDDDILVLHKVDGSGSILVVRKGEPTLTIGVEAASTFQISDGEYLFASRKVTYLVDTGGQGINEPKQCRGWNILTSSPAQRHYNSYEGNCNPTWVYYAPWELDELLAAKPTWMKREDVIERFSLVSGIPRFVFADGSKYKQICQQLNGAITSINWASEDSWRLGNPLDLSHRIFIHKPCEYYENISTDFASRQIAKKAYDYLNKVDRSTLSRLMDTTRHEPKFAAMWGHLYETSFFSHLSDLSKKKKTFHLSLKRLLQHRNPLIGKPLSSAEEEGVTDVKDLKLDIADVIVAKDVKAQIQQYAHSPGVMAIYPNVDNSPTIDGLILDGSTIYGIQVTKSATHSVSPEGLRNLREYKEILTKLGEVSIILIIAHPAADRFKLGKKAWDVLGAFPEIKVYEAKWLPSHLEEASVSNESLPSRSTEPSAHNSSVFGQ